MHFILKTLVLEPTPKKLSTYLTKFQPAFKGQNAFVDRVVNGIVDFHHSYQEFPKAQSILDSLKSDGHNELYEFLEELLADESISAYADESEFISALELERKDWLHKQAQSAIRSAWSQLKNPTEASTANILKTADALQTKLQRLKTACLGNEESISSLLFGSEDVAGGHALPQIYGRIKEKNGTSEAVYFDLGIEKFAEARFKDGDLVVFGGFTSHGKSILLRHFAYRQIYHYGRNVAFFSAEMSHDACRAYFAIMHANNKAEYPSTPYIEFEKWRTGQLTAEEEDFLFNVADWDLRNQAKYGTLYIDQPNKSKFRLSDLATKLTELEQIMPVHCVVVDYLTLLHPLESDRGRPERLDFNDLIKDFKNLLLAHRDVKGAAAPMLGVTAHQISRSGLDACLKADRRYEISAFSEYSEIERSADHLFTVLMTPDLKELKQMRLQHLKNRDGAVVSHPIDVGIDFARGMQLLDMQERSHLEIQQIIQNIRI